MVIMAGMLPGVECARRRRIRQGGAAEAPPCWTRRPAFCLYNAGGHDHAHWGSAAAAASKLQERSSGDGGVCKEMARAWWTLDSGAREAKERLDRKLRGQRESVAKRRQRTQATSTSGGADGSSSSNNLHHSSPTAATAEAGVLQREVWSKPRAVGGARGFSWSRLGRCRPPTAAAAPDECAVCLEELRGGDVVARLPCAHRFHWPCAVPWVQAASRCPVCRARVVVLASSPS